MGISGVTITDEIAEYYSLPRRGVLVMRVGSYSPASYAGIIVGDVIVGIDDDKIDNMDDLQNALKIRKIGDSIEVSVARSARHLRMELTLGEAE
jgi:serine protease Do